MPNPFLTPPQNKKGRHNEKRQVQERGNQGNPFLGSGSRRNCFSDCLSNPTTFREPASALTHAPPPPPPSFEESFPCLSSKAPGVASSRSGPAPLNFKRVVQANLQQDPQQQPQQPQPQPQPHQEQRQEQRKLNMFLSNTTNVQCKTSLNVRVHRDYNDDDDYDEDTGAYDSAYTKYYND